LRRGGRPLRRRGCSMSRIAPHAAPGVRLAAAQRRLGRSDNIML